MRLWANGNLHAYIEPDDTGYRLRLRTVKSDALAFTALGLIFLAFAAITIVLLVLTGGLAEKGLMGPLFMAAMGGGARRPLIGTQRRRRYAACAVRHARRPAPPARQRARRFADHPAVTEVPHAVVQFR